jgi:hypothetical protein
VLVLTNIGRKSQENSRECGGHTPLPRKGGLFPEWSTGEDRLYQWCRVRSRLGSSNKLTVCRLNPFVASKNYHRAANQAFTEYARKTQLSLLCTWAFTEYAHTRITETGFRRDYHGLGRVFTEPSRVEVGLHRVRPHQLLTEPTGFASETITVPDESSQSLLELSEPSQSTPTPESQSRLGFRQSYHGLGRVFTEPSQIGGPSQSTPTPVTHRVCWVSCRLTESASFRCPNAQITVQA